MVAVSSKENNALFQDINALKKKHIFKKAMPKQL